MQGYPCINNANGVELTIVKVTNHEDWTIIGVYRSPQISTRNLCMALSNVLTEHGAGKTIIMGDFNVNWMAEDERRPLYSLMIEDNGYQQLVPSCTTDSNTLIDHLYTNVPNVLTEVNCGVFETYFTDHKIIWASFQ